MGPDPDAWLRRLVSVTQEVADRLAEGDDADRQRMLLADVRDLHDRLKARLSTADSGPSEREARIAQNELLFRQINERIDELTDQREQAIMSAVCECGRADCVAPIELRLADYHRIRSDRHFIVIPGHEILDVERVVQREAAYLVVEKVDDAPELAKRS